MPPRRALNEADNCPERAASSQPHNEPHRPLVIRSGRPNHRSPDQPLKASRSDRPRSTRSDSRVVSSLPESCEPLPPKTVRSSSQSTATTIITTEIAMNTKVKITQASVAHNSRSHKRFIGKHYNSSRRVRETAKSRSLSISGIRELLLAVWTDDVLPINNCIGYFAILSTIWTSDINKSG